MGPSKSVLVTGATGFIGRATVSTLIDAGWKVTEASRTIDKPLSDKVVFLDLSNIRTLLNLDETSRFDCILHIGAHVGWSGGSDSDLYVPNVLSTGCLAYLASKWGAHLVFTSAAIVHGVKKELIQPDTPLCPDTVYAKSKWLGEQLIISSNVSHCILRIAGVFGKNGPEHLGLNKVITAAMSGEIPIQIGTGKALRNYIYVEDVAMSILKSLDERLEGTYLLAGYEVLSVQEMLNTVCEIFTPGKKPFIKEGSEAMNQVISPSNILPRSRKFRDALVDIFDKGAV